jgi:hypothetical protein
MGTGSDHLTLLDVSTGFKYDFVSDSDNFLPRMAASSENLIFGAFSKLELWTK